MLDREDLEALLYRGVQALAIVGALVVVAVAAGLAWRLFDLVKG